MSITAPQSLRHKIKPGKVGAYVFLGFTLFISLFPVFWMVRTAVTKNAYLWTNKFSLFPNGIFLGNFKRILGMSTLAQSQALGGSGESINFLPYLFNSLKFTAAVVAGTVLFSVCAGYALARLNFRGRNGIFYLLMAGLLAPTMFVTIPNFMLILKLHLLNTFAGTIAPFVFGTPFAVFFMRQFFISFPKEIEEAAEIDGLGVFGRLRKIVLPMSTPPIFTLALITGVTAWNEYLWPYLVSNGQQNRVLTVALRVFLSQTPQGSPDWSGLMAASTLTLIPVVITLAVFGKKMIGSIQLNGFK